MAYINPYTDYEQTIIEKRREICDKCFSHVYYPKHDRHVCSICGCELMEKTADLRQLCADNPAKW